MAEDVNVVMITNFEPIMRELDAVLAKAKQVRAETDRIQSQSPIGRPLGKNGTGDKPAIPNHGGSSNVVKANNARRIVPPSVPLTESLRDAPGVPVNAQQDAASRANPGSKAPFSNSAQDVPKTKTQNLSPRKIQSVGNAVASGDVLSMAMQALGPKAAYAYLAHRALDAANTGSRSVVEALRESQDTGIPISETLARRTLQGAANAVQAANAKLTGIMGAIQHLGANVSEVIAPLFGVSVDRNKADGWHAGIDRMVAKSDAIAAGTSLNEIERLSEMQWQARLGYLLAVAEKQEKKLREQTVAQLAGQGVPGSYRDLDQVFATKIRHKLFDPINEASNAYRNRQGKKVYVDGDNGGG